MDLAQHLKLSAEELRSLRNVIGLIRHDVTCLQADPSSAQKQEVHNANTSMHATSQNDFNPFLTGRNLHHNASVKSMQDAGVELQAAHLQSTQRTNMERILNEHESMNNQLSLTSKIKQSLETELVQSKLAHASEMQGVIQKMSNAEKKLHEMHQARS